jgi:hypothetical protein
MKSHITKEEARAFKARWAAVNSAEKEELRATSIEKKAGQLAALMESAALMGWREPVESEQSMVRERWNELRRVCRK